MGYTGAMTKVAKLILIDKNDNYLLLYRSNHPIFGDDADLPGGIVERGETFAEGVIRETQEEIGATVTDVRELHTASKYSRFGTQQSLFVTHVTERPEVVLSWEHKHFEWLSKEAFLEKAKHARDSYMHMVYEIVRTQ